MLTIPTVTASIFEIDPSIETEIERAAHDKVAVLVVPIAFVSDHSETLVELDVEYRELAEKLHLPGRQRPLHLRLLL